MSRLNGDPLPAGLGVQEAESFSGEIVASSRRMKNGWKRPNRAVAVFAAAVIVATSFLSWGGDTRPYPSAPSYCTFSSAARNLSPISPGQSLSAALLSLKALKDCFGGPLSSYRGPYTSLTSAWPESQALAAMIGLAGVSHSPASLKSSIAQNISVLRNYRDPNGGYQPNGRWYSTGAGVRKFDDNAWLGLDLARAYMISRDHRYLDQAKAIATFETTGWSLNRRFAKPGGIFWQEPRYGHHRNAVSTAGAALLNARLYSITGSSLYLKRAWTYLRWTVSALTLSNGLIGDQISPNGSVNHKIWSYNQGLVIDTYTSLYQATKNPADLAAARLFANRSLSYFCGHNRLERQPQVFDAIYLKSLAELYKVAPDSQYLRELQSYATYLYERMSPSTGVIHLGPVTSPSTGWLLTQAAAIQVFTAYASAGKNAIKT